MSSRTKNVCSLSRAWQACSSLEEPITCSASVIKSQAVVQGPGGCHRQRSMPPSAKGGASSRSVPRALRRQVDREQRPGSPRSVVCEQMEGDQPASHASGTPLIHHFLQTDVPSGMPLQGREKNESLREPDSQIEEFSETYEANLARDGLS